MQTHEYRDFDAFADSVQGVDCQMMQDKPTKRIWSITDIDLGDTKVQHGQLGSANIVEGETAADAYLLYMPLTATCEYKFNGVPVKKNDLAILEPNSEFRFSTIVEHDFCMAVVSASHFADMEECSCDAKRSTVRVARGNLQSARKLCQIVHQILSSAASCPQFESKVAAKHASAALVRVASKVVAHELQQEAVPQLGRARLPRSEIIERSMALLEDVNAEPVHVRELATAAGVSERSLRRSFQEYFGVGPIHYLQLRRLHLINRVLREADPDANSVTEILAQHGEWQFGRFATRYRQLFGELPSETLRATRP
ncbi:transcriptional regulator EutR [Planctomycetes bacterium MalM25]|nr:transcriptional regulator EutR [Planctomycetes bacterium MalM25]